MKKIKKCPKYKECQHGAEGCIHLDDRYECIHYLPLDGTNLTKLVFTVESPPNVTSEMVMDKFINWIDYEGFIACGFSREVNNDDTK